MPLLPTIFLSLLLLLLLYVESFPTDRSPELAPWLPHRASGCSRRPFMCRKEQRRAERKRCCRNRCVDVRSDGENCGFCRRRCRFPRRCCRGVCVDMNTSWFNCGRCGKRCGFGVRCEFGMCGYGQPPPDRRPPEMCCLKFERVD